MKTAAALILATILATLAGCNGDGANPFEKPDAPEKTTEPVSCAASASCG